jgi:Cdc6-like AAA superfamily ATPase
MLLVSNKPPSQIDLENRSQSRLGYRTLQFTPYEKDDLEPILKAKAAQAFKSHSLGDHVIETIADKTVEELSIGSGDCRHAIEILHRAGREADQAQADKVTAAHVERAINPIRQKAETEAVSD